MICLTLFATAAVDAPSGRTVGPALAGVGGLLAGALVAWSLGRSLENAYYRAVLAMLAVFGTAIIGALTVPAHVAAGRWGLAVLGALCVVGVAGARRIFLGRGS